MAPSYSSIYRIYINNGIWSELIDINSKDVEAILKMWMHLNFN